MRLDRLGDELSDLCQSLPPNADSARVAERNTADHNGYQREHVNHDGFLSNTCYGDGARAALGAMMARLD
jgi:hypothetical protein